ncbi:MAG TPA: TonB-dependent receptor [Saprospiraceae bacterium]|nr:TonB-dependent receptor [Saprospiraceae bacterium]
MKKIFQLIILCLLIQTTSWAQFPMMGNQSSIKGRISGVLQDSLTGETIPYASVVLKRAGNDRILNGVISDDSGLFRFNDVAVGKYDIFISFLGYEEKSIPGIETTGRSPDLNLGIIYMITDALLLDEVQVTEQRSLIENQVDKLVFNAEQDASLAGGDATDVLRKVPTLSVDLDGNVSLRGSQNVQILINGKPSGMFSSNVADALRMFPADQIKRVEVITSPSAKYDGEGSAGIINIVTKRDQLEGIAGNINTSIGNIQNNANFGLNAGKGRFGLTTNGGVFYSRPVNAINQFQREQTINGLTSSIETDGTNRTSRLGFNGSLNAFYDINAYHAINTSASLRGFGFRTDGVINGNLVDNIRNFTDVYTRDNEGTTLNSGFDWSTDYTIKFPGKEGRELVFGYQLSGNVNNQDFRFTELHDNPFLNRRERQDNEGLNLESTIQIDYTHPFAKASKLEIGAKAILRDIDSDYRFDVFNENNGLYEFDNARSNLFFYDQDVYAGYVNMSTIIAKKYSLSTGLRYERTDIAGLFQQGEGQFDNGYNSFLPNITVSRNLKNFRTLKASYNRRIQRPSLRFVNPFNNSVEIYNQTVGNPYLDPELVDQFELTYNFNFKGFTFFTSAFHRITKGIIEQIVGVQSGISINTFDNVGTNHSTGLNLFTSKTISGLTVRGGGNFFQYNGSGVVNGERLQTKSFQYNLFFNGDIKITGSIKADFFGFFRAPNQNLQGVTPAFSIWGFGIRKDFKNSGIGIRVIQPERANQDFYSELRGSNFVQTSLFSVPFRSFGINYRYKFGKVDFKERRSKVTNKDLKEGGDAMQQGGAGNSN